MDFFTLLGALVAAGSSALVPAITRLLDERRAESDPDADLRRRLHALRDALADAEPLIDELATELDARAQRVQRLKDEIAEHQDLLSLTADQVSAIEGLVKKESNRGLWVQFVMALGFFAAGVLVTLALA